MKKVMHFLACLAGALVIAKLPAQAQDWPQWRGADRDAHTAFVPPASWPKQLTEKWRVSVGEGVATPVLVKDRVYVFGRQNGAEILRCLDAADGKEVWQDKYDALGATGPASGFSGPRATPGVADGKVVTLGVRGVLSCLDAAKGKLLWRHDDFPGAWPRFFVASSPLLVDGLCVAQLGAGDNGCIAAYKLGDGSSVWKWTGDGPAYSSPGLMVVAGTKLVVALTETKLVVLSLGEGKLVWETPFLVPGRGYNAATPIVDGKTLYYAGSGRGVTAVRFEKTGDKFNVTELWKNPDNSVMFNTPVLKNGLLYGLSAGNDFFCLSAADGKTAWTAPSAPAPAGENPSGGGGRGGRMGGRGGYGSIVDAGSVLLALTPGSDLIAFSPGEKSYAEVARIHVAPSPTYAYPVVSGNRVFIKDQDSLALLGFP